MKIITTPEFFPKKAICYIEQKYKAKYVMEYCIKNGQNWLNKPSLIFYSEKKHPEGSHYFAVTPHKDHVIITNAGFVEDLSISAAEDSNGNIFFSRFRHDFREINEAFIDGGPEYTRYGGKTTKLHQLKIKDGELYVVTD